MTQFGTKLTVHVDPDEYFKFTHKMHHGQISQIIRKFISAANNIPTAEFNLWAYGDETLTLDQPKEE